MSESKEIENLIFDKILSTTTKDFKRNLADCAEEASSKNQDLGHQQNSRKPTTKHDNFRHIRILQETDMCMEDVLVEFQNVTR